LILQAIKANVLSQLREGRELLAASNVKSEALALVIDGKSLTYALEDDVKDLFLAFAVGCASVICCRSSPKQKALVCFPCVFH
jgi:phospholipid-translocating ATPase